MPGNLLQVSRPGLWLVFIWLYMWPLGGSTHLLSSPVFWLGLLFCTFPLNLLVYGMNDLVDEDVDRNNPRKGNYIYGAKLSRKQLSNLPLWILASNVIPLMVISVYSPGLSLFLSCWLLSAIAVNFVYNNKPFQLSRKCPYELPTMVIGHFLIPVLACVINDTPWPSKESWIFHALLLSRSHIWLEFADIGVDQVQGKRTIAVVLGHHVALRLVLVLTLLESLCAYFLLQSPVLGTFSLFGLGVFWFATARGSGKTENSTMKDEKLHVSVSQSIVGAVLMVYLWTQKVLV